MAFLTVKLLPGVHTEQTPLLLQAGIVASNLIRFRAGLAEKLGGWMQAPFLANATLSGPIRELWPWADFSGNEHLAAGGDQGVYVPTDNVSDITPQYTRDNLTPDGATVGFSTTAGSPTVVVNDPNANTNLYGTITINNHVSVGGLILFGQYQIAKIDSPSKIEITAASNASATVTDGGTVVSVATQANSEIVAVTLANHGLAVGERFEIAIPLTISGVNPNPPNQPWSITLSGSYDVLTVPDANTFTIAANQKAISAVTANDNPDPSTGAGRAQVIYWLVPAPQPPYSGWGNPGWGGGGWGTGVPPPQVAGTRLTKVTTPWNAAGVLSLDWCLVNFGEELIAQPEGGPFFHWNPDSGLGSLQPITAAPAVATGFFLAMPQQQLVAYGASAGVSNVADPMLVRWCDNADYTDWVASASNQAGSYRLTRGSRIIGGLQAPQQAMLWTDVGFWLMTYLGYPDVYGFAEVAQECGLVAKKAAGVCGAQVFWMGFDGFWTYVSGAVQPLPCEVWDVIYQNLIQMAPDPAVLDRIRFGSNAGFNEAWWFFPSRYSTTGENDSYVKFNRLTGEWDYGVGVDPLTGAVGGLAVSEWIDANIFGHPMSAMTQSGAASSTIMQHEMGHNADGAAGAPQPLHWWFKTGLFLLSEGEDFIFVDRCRPDFKWRTFQDPQTVSSSVEITLYTQDEPDNPSKPPAVYGPFICTDASGPFDPRARGRYFSMKVEGDDLNSFTRMGGVKFRFAPDGRN